MQTALASICLLVSVVVATKILPGEWSATNAKHPNQKAWAVGPHFLLEVKEAEVEWECEEAEAWTAAGPRVVPEVSEEAGEAIAVASGEAIVVDSGAAAAWTEAVSVVPAVVDRPWVAEEGEWAHQVARWI